MLVSTAVGDHVNKVTNDIVEGVWRVDPPVGICLPRPVGRNNTQFAIQQRKLLKDYVNSSTGSVAWQENII